MPEGQSSTKPLLSKYALCQEFYPAEAHKGERCTCFDQKPSEPVTIKKHNYSTAHTQIPKRPTAKAAAPASTLRDLVHHTGSDRGRRLRSQKVQSDVGLHELRSPQRLEWNGVRQCKQSGI